MQSEARWFIAVGFPPKSPSPRRPVNHNACRRSCVSLPIHARLCRYAIEHARSGSDVLFSGVEAWSGMEDDFAYIGMRHLWGQDKPCGGVGESHHAGIEKAAQHSKVAWLRA